MIKTFEVYKKYIKPEGKYFWVVPTDKKRFRRSLIEIGCSPSFINVMIGNINIKTDFIFIEFASEPTKFQLHKINRGWAWNHYDVDEFKEYEDKGNKFMGYINIEPYEIEATKYNF